MKLKCEVLGVTESGYYQWFRNRDKPTKRDLLSIEIRKLLDEEPDNKNYGCARVHLALLQRGVSVSKGTVRLVMKENDWLHPRRRRPHGITKATTEIQEQENLIKRDFSSTEPMRKFLTDITEVQCLDGKLYISTIMDCYSGEIVALAMRDHMKKELCIETLKDLALRAGDLSGAIIHSDRGSQYTSAAYRAEVRRLGMLQSLSGTGHCFDNARMESFFATLKKEKIYQISAHKRPMEEVKSLVFRYVFTYYNRKRVYTGNPDGLPPSVYRERVA